MECTEKGYLKIHVAIVNIKTKKEILALEVTDEKVIHDGKMMEKLVEDVVLKINHAKKKEVRINSLILVMDLIIQIRISNS